MKARMTSARQAIFDELDKSHHHLKANEIHERLTGRLPSLNLSTVYRSLDYLVEHGVISVSDLGIGSPVYEVVHEDQHHHIVCQGCNQIFELEDDLVAPFFETIEEEKQMVVITNHLVIYALCKECKEA